MLNLTTLLSTANINPSDVLVLRHRPIEAKLRKSLPALALKRPDLFRFYQQLQYPKVESAMRRATYIASFVGLDDNRSIFCYLYRNAGPIEIDEKTFWRMPENGELRDGFGMLGWLENDRKTALWFELKEENNLMEYRGRLEITWAPPAKSWYRWAHKNSFPITAIHEESVLDSQPIDWRMLSLEWVELTVLPKSWEDKLSQWRGIYLIENTKDRKLYVGAAYGENNLLGRWRDYMRSGDGGNKLLKNLDPKFFRFSILQITAHDLPADEVIELEKTWKKRLNTFAPNGLNMQ